jgi:replication-associated recombination protein RarA
MGYAIKTKKGYDFFECSGAIQKGIRRNDEKVALYFMVELFNSGYDEYVWKRLKIIVSEDVGIATPNAAANIHALYNFYSEHKKKKDPKKEERIFLTHAVIYLCRCEKSRLNVWNCFSLWREHMDNDMPIPEYAYDMHNVKGKTMGRGFEHFWYGDDKDTLGGCHLENHNVQEGENEMKEHAYEIGTKYPKVDWARIEAGKTNELF